MAKDLPVKGQEQLLQDFDKDTQIVGEQVSNFLRIVYPSYLVDRNNINSLLDKDSSLRLESMTFFRISSCTADNVDKVFENVNERFEKLFTALYSINIPVAYGVVSCNGITNLVIGVYRSGDVDSVKMIVQGMLSGIELTSIEPNFKLSTQKVSHGILAGVPSLYVKDQKQKFSLSSIMRSLNGQNYTLLFIAKPVKKEMISGNIADLISVRDKAFAVSKRNIARSHSFTNSNTETRSENDSKNNIAGQAGSGAGAAIGAVIGGLTGAVPGAVVGGIVGSGLGTLIGNIVGQGKSHSEGYSKSVSDAITKGETVSGDIQNGFAIELMNYADNAIERLKGGQNNGIWQTAIVYSAETDIARNIIRACLSGELSKPNAANLPMIAFEPDSSPNAWMRIPEFLEDSKQNPLCSYINSAELGLLCTVPTESVPDFELRLEKRFPLIASRMDKDSIAIGNVVDGKHVLENMPFALSEMDLNKHTFVCGITGSGKTTTVKKILIEAHKPFLVIESAKKEYRNIKLDTEVYTLGKPEINAPQMNPFYIMPGVSPQVHIDFLKDLFNASFSFYGPMPYILEKCLHAVYKNKGWDLTLGYHPLLANTKSTIDFFNIEHIEKQYSCESHKFLFPTMQELKDEIARYIDDELKYNGEVAGNVKTAMQVRLENLCGGTKGFTFNTSEFVNFDELLKKNVIFELEGLADDSDKAFSVGLLVIFINEYRQVRKEIDGSKKTGLQHLLVIEEAHRLLKNVDTERSVESLGNPKGKAVEHFTNMIAEMRSYGQGIIVAEQIPTKLAPDVIKNSSTKIVQRIVSVDDQKIIANTIGVSENDAIQLGSLKTGYAYCHKEGMSFPVPIKMKQDSDVFVSDELLYNKYNESKERFFEINLSVIRSNLGNSIQVKKKVLGFINTIMTEDISMCESACKALLEFIDKEIKILGIQFVVANDSWNLYAKYLTEEIITMMIRGVYRTKALPDNEFAGLLAQMLYSPTEEIIKRVKDSIRFLYTKDIERYAQENVAALVWLKLNNDTNIPATINEYFLDVSDCTLKQIIKMVEEHA